MAGAWGCNVHTHVNTYLRGVWSVQSVGVSAFRATSRAAALSESESGFTRRGRKKRGSKKTLSGAFSRSKFRSRWRDKRWQSVREEA